MASNEYTADLDQITATRVAEADRLRVLPQYCGVRYMLSTENAVYNWMGALSTEYGGGVWEFYELSNGGFYMAPSARESFAIKVNSNYYEGRMSADAAGITACLFAFGQIAGQTCEQRIIDLYHQLREFAHRHFECSEIFAAID